MEASGAPYLRAKQRHQYQQTGVRRPGFLSPPEYDDDDDQTVSTETRSHGDYDEVRKLERGAITRDVNNFHKQRKAEQITRDQRWPMLYSIRKKTLDGRKKKGIQLAEEHALAKKRGWAEEEELNLLRTEFHSYLDGGADDEDEDDEEPDPANIKAEPAEMDHYQGRSNNRFGETTAMMEDAQTMQVEEGFAVQQTFNLDRLIAESNGLEYQPDLKHIRRQRSCAGLFGKMIVWPPIGDEGRKRKAEETKDNGRAKRVNFR